MRFMKEAAPQLQKYLTAATTDTVEQIQELQKAEIADNAKDVQAWLKARGFTQGQAKNITEKAEAEPGNPRSRWNLVQAVTNIAQDCPFGDERLDMERMATKLMK
jgi:predicted membrane metal-binding protein